MNTFFGRSRTTIVNLTIRTGRLNGLQGMGSREAVRFLKQPSDQPDDWLTLYITTAFTQHFPIVRVPPFFDVKCSIRSVTRKYIQKEVLKVKLPRRCYIAIRRSRTRATYPLRAAEKLRLYYCQDNSPFPFSFASSVALVDGFEVSNFVSWLLVPRHSLSALSSFLPVWQLSLCAFYHISQHFFDESALFRMLSFLLWISPR